ncbi:hypothetical protein DJ69_16925 [Halorubrum persicum]|uniref:Uncharacterized protein n=1 Tax=Halorubrum persicum TaxID=1383844 RepID=A0A2G1WER1_9EURY|nr:hypothetical protein [Halorubrum persicum]PHQ37477.1 hypothetical protein DJ69_16925 [Halorubrum persicum]
MTERKQINVKIKADKAERWNNAVEDNPEYASMTDLIRQSVEKELAGSETPTQSTGKGVVEVKDEIGTIGSKVDRLEKALEGIQDSIETEPSDKHLRSEIFALLPAMDSMKGPMSPEEVSRELGPVDTSVVADTLEKMAQEIGVVQEVFENNEVLYYKDDS